jgi:hypothetical protein
MTENIGNVYPLTIPSITDNADIQTAFRLYHYGSDTTTPGTPDNESLAGYLSNLENAKIDIVTKPLPTSVNLNDITDTGFYTQTSTPTAPNYPSNFAGLLTVVNSGSLKTGPDDDENSFNNKQQNGVIFQQYQVVGAPESESSINTLNRTHWRFYFAGAWRPWRTYIDDANFSTKGDLRYYTQSAANNLFYTKTHIDDTFFTKTEALASQYLLENVQTESYALALSDINKVVAMNNSAAATVTVPNNSGEDGVAFPVGTVINIYRMTDQPVDVVGDLGVTVRNAGNIYEQYTEISLRKRATNEWVASGNIIPA